MGKRREVIGARFFATLNKLIADPLADIVSEISILRTDGIVKVGRAEIINYFRDWLAPIENMQIHTVMSAKNDTSLWFETNVLIYGRPAYDCFWILAFHEDDSIKLIKFYRTSDNP
jgi:hypothetical protein